MRGAAKSAARFFLQGGKTMVIINGEKVNADGITVEQYIKSSDYNTAFIAVELNEDIIPKANYASTVLKDGDVLEVVNFVGGG
jgi:sulfur carrier protein